MEDWIRQNTDLFGEITPKREKQKDKPTEEPTEEPKETKESIEKEKEKEKHIYFEPSQEGRKIIRDIDLEVSHDAPLERPRVESEFEEQECVKEFMKVPWINARVSRIWLAPRGDSDISAYVGKETMTTDYEKEPRFSPNSSPLDWAEETEREIEGVSSKIT